MLKSDPLVDVSSEAVPSVMPTNWHRDNFIAQIASAALGQFGLLDKISPGELIELTSGLVIAEGDSELQDDLLSGFLNSHAAIRDIKELNNRFVQALEWFEQAAQIDPSSDKIAANGEDHFSCVGTKDNGAHVDYRNEIKEKWRLYWRAVLNGLTDPDERKNMKILCLPSPQVWPEIRHYLELGFRAENIVGVEGGDSEARTIFESNAKRFGITPKVGQLENVLPKMKERFDIVLLDFLGPISIKIQRIISTIPLSKRVIVGVNMMAARESEATQASLDIFRHSPHIVPIVTTSNKKIDFSGTASAKTQQRLIGKLQAIQDDGEFGEVRDFLAPYVALGLFARADGEDRLCHLLNQVAGKIGFDLSPELVPALRHEILPRTLQLVFETLDQLSDSEMRISLMLRSIVGLGMVSYSGFSKSPLFTQNIGYYSSVSDRQIPYHSTFSLLGEVEQDYSSESSISAQILNLFFTQVTSAYLQDVELNKVGCKIGADSEPFIVFDFGELGSYQILLGSLMNEFHELGKKAASRLSLSIDNPDLIVGDERIWLNSRVKEQ